MFRRRRSQLRLPLLLIVETIVRHVSCQMSSSAKGFRCNSASLCWCIFVWMEASTPCGVLLLIALLHCKQDQITHYRPSACSIPRSSSFCPQSRLLKVRFGGERYVLRGEGSGLCSGVLYCAQSALKYCCCG